LEIKIAFKALIKNINNKSLVSGDKETWVTLKLQDDNVKVEILNALNELHDPTKQVMVVIMEDEGG